MSIDCKHCPLRRRDAFADLGEEELAFLRRFKMGELSIEAGAPIILEGANSPHFHTVLNGVGLRSKSLIDGRTQVVNVVFPGDLVGLQANLFGEMKHSVYAVTSMRLCVFSRDRMWELYRDHPARAFDVTWLAAREARSLAEYLLSLGQRTARERTAALLLIIDRRSRQTGFAPATGSVPFPFRQQDMADAMGLSLVHTNKMLQALRQDGLIKLADGKLEIPDADALAEEALAFDLEDEGPRALM